MEDTVSAEDAKGHFELKSMIFQYITPFMLKTVVLLGIPDLISKAGRPLSLDEIVSKLPNAKNPQPSVLRRIMHYLVHKKVFDESVGDGGELYYGLNNISKWLAEEHHYLLLCMHECGQSGFQKVHEAVLNGGYAYDIANGHHVWDAGKDNPEYNNLLNDAMVVWSRITITLILENYDGFKDVKKLVDVGGGLGMCMRKIVKKYPHIEGVNFDLPHCIVTAPELPGVQHISGDMFESVPSGDGILLKSIFINFDDKACSKVLANCYKALPHGGKIIVVELIYTREGPFEVDLDMIMIGYTDGGKSRSFDELKALLETSGFSNVTLINVPSKEQVIEAYKV